MARMEHTAIAIVHNPPHHRFEASLDGHLARAEYRVADGVMRMTHTEVPREFEGRGVAAALVRTALGYAREHGLRVAPQCPYVVGYMRRHPETHDLLPPGFEL
jgi:predicted GNAT family acetyltransferase